MTSEEAKECLFNGAEVICQGITYKRITGILYRLSESGKRIVVSAELLDKNKNSVVIAPLNMIERADKC